MIHSADPAHLYHAPNDLRVGRGNPRRVMVIGSCAIGSLPHYVESMPDGAPCDFFNVNHGCFLPETPPHHLDEYDFQIVQIPLRTLLPESVLMRLGYSDVVGHEQLFDSARRALDFSLNNALRWSTEHGLTAFVTNFLVPQQNAYGRLLPRYDLRNPVYMIEALNRHLAELLEGYPDAYLLDADQIAAMHGRRHIQDDSVYLFSHGALLGDYDAAHDAGRLELPTLLTEVYAARVPEYLLSLWSEALAMHRTLRGIDSVKLVVVDLDDTIWRGVVAEGEAITPHAVEGWPIGFVEALLYLKRRGILLAVLSRNEDSRVRELWDQLYGDRLSPDDFAAWNVSWSPKTVGMAQILKDLNLLPLNVLFVDDNPVERAAMQSAYPDLRVIGQHPYSLRRLMLWAPETQPPLISAESTRRTEMTQAQVVRDNARQAMSRAEFLESLSPRVTLFEVAGSQDARFLRVLELLNKTNQFNTTGRRWTRPELEREMALGLRVFAFDVEDRFTAYGLVGVALLTGRVVTQFVQSCRVLGLDVEAAAISAILARLPAVGAVEGVLVHTAANAPVRDLWLKLGFTAERDRFILPASAAVACPKHVTVSAP